MYKRQERNSVKHPALAVWELESCLVVDGAEVLDSRLKTFPEAQAVEGEEVNEQVCGGSCSPRALEEVAELLAGQPRQARAPRSRWSSHVCRDVHGGEAVLVCPSVVPAHGDEFPGDGAA